MHLKKTFGLLSLLALPHFASAYDAQAVELANLRQDMIAMAEHIGKLQLDIETLQRENIGLRQAMNTQRAQAPSDTHLSALKAELSQNFQLQKQEIFTQVSKQIEQLGTRTQGALDSLARAIGTNKPSIAGTIKFSDDYPQEGIAYTVQPGDTLGGIAHKHNSAIKDIQNANRIADPTRDLIAGNTIFIPQRNTN
tara:strand:- start:5466 stop:6050 length:585 start_codon:yes stop_codon:yes gene_type:complete